MKNSIVALSTFAAIVAAQKVGTETEEVHPSMSWQRCTAPGSCSTVSASVVIDANWRWLHPEGGYDNCYDGNEWLCGSESECTECAIEGANYDSTYGASTSGDALTLKFLTEHEYGTNIGSRFYLMESEDSYQMFKLMGNEFAFDVDLSTLECGLNGALYFVAMEPDGGLGGTNEAGAKYGTGYCDAQCARDLKFVDGVANSDGWAPSTNDPNAGVGKYGGCCAEIDVWESNAHSFALTPHPCINNNYHVCSEDEGNCGGTYSDERFAGDCDANGCDYNPYRMGNTDFYGKGMTVDTNKVFTVVTRFEENKMTQFFVQDGVKIDIPGPKHEGLTEFGSEITPELCDAMFEVFGDFNRFEEVGGWPLLNDALELEHVLVMSIWDDHYANMLWLDSSYPPEKAGTPGGDRGPCPQDSGVPSEVEAEYADSSVTYSNIRFGPVGSTVEV